MAYIIFTFINFKISKRVRPIRVESDEVEEKALSRPRSGKELIIYKPLNKINDIYKKNYFLKSKFRKSLKRKKMPRYKRKRKASSMSAASIRRIVNKEVKAQFPRGSAQSVQQYGQSLQQVKAMAMLGDETAKQQLQRRYQDGFVGRGGYFDSLMSHGRQAARGLGGLLTSANVLAKGGNMSDAERAWIRGSRRGNRVATAIGMGDYDMSSNQIVSAGSHNPQQNIHHMTSADDLSGDIIYSNTEFVKNVYATITSGASPFNIESFALNPGLEKTFPFLSQIAQNFELFEFVGLMFQYKPTSGEFGSNNSNALGKVVLATNYDPDAPEFKNSIIMENYDYACSTKPSSGCIHGVECAPSQRSTTQMYTRGGVSTKDKVFTDLGSFQIATEGVPSSVAQTVLVGELWVTYTVKLSRAKLYSAIGSSIEFYNARVPTGANTFNLGSVTLNAQNSLSVVMTEVLGAPAELNLRFAVQENGRFLIQAFYRPGAGTAAAIVFGTYNNCTMFRETEAFGFATSSLAKVSSVVIDINAAASGAQASFNVIPTSNVVAGDIWIAVTRVDPDFDTAIAI